MAIPFGDLQRQYRAIKPDVDRAVLRVLDRGWFILGAEVLRFEKKFAAFCKARYCVGVANGMEALQIALMAVGIKKGDEVITSPLSAMATVLAILNVGATPVFADIDEASYTIDPKEIEKLITRKTRAILPVHLYGQPARMDAIMRIARQRKLKVIEDAAQAHGAKFRGKHVGTFGDMGAFSFYPSKNLGAYGDGGCIVTNNPELARKARILRDYGQDGRYHHVLVGLNSRLDELQAAILSAKMKYLGAWTRRKRKLSAEYSARLKRAPLVLPSQMARAYHVWHLYVVRTSKRNRLQKYLSARGIGTQIHFPKVLYRQPAFRRLRIPMRAPCPRAEAAVNEILSLPLYPEMSRAELLAVCSAVKDFFRHGTARV